MNASEGKRLVQRSGAIWKKKPKERLRIVANVCRKLRKVYGKPRLGNPRDPVDDLVYIVISNKTSPRLAQETFKRLRRTFATWDDLLNAPRRTLTALLRPAGLSNIKSSQLRRALRKIKNDFDSYDLRGLRRQPEEVAHGYLKSLSGVSDKVAKCIMMYTLGSCVLPVDSHVHRIAGRLGWTKRKRADQCHEELESLVARPWRCSFHIDCVLHGRAVCRPVAPKCGTCCIRHYCDYFKHTKSKS